jgi:hypothetical protein
MPKPLYHRGYNLIAIRLPKYNRENITNITGHVEKKYESKNKLRKFGEEETQTSSEQSLS